MPARTIGAVCVLFLSLALVTAVPIFKSAGPGASPETPVEAAALAVGDSAFPPTPVHPVAVTSSGKDPMGRTASGTTIDAAMATPPMSASSLSTGSDRPSPSGRTATSSSGSFSAASLTIVTPPRDPAPSAYRPHPGLLGSREVRPSQPPRPRPLRRALTAAERHLLAHLIHAEAAGEPYEGQVAVAAVILNRLDSPDFPDTVEGVVFERMAFESVSNGRLWQGTSAVAYRALDDALRGYDPTGGALYFYNPRYVRPGNWILTRPVIQIIGQHYFAI